MIFMEDFFEDEDYLADVQAESCYDDPVEAMYRIAYEGELNYKKLEEAVQEDLLSEGVVDSAKAKFETVKGALMKMVEWVKKQFSKILGAITSFVQELQDKKFNKNIYLAVNKAKDKGLSTITLEKPIKTYDYETNKAISLWKRVEKLTIYNIDVKFDDDVIDRLNKSDVDSEKIAMMKNICGKAVSNTSEFKKAIMTTLRGEKQIEIKTFSVNDFNKDANIFREAQNTVKTGYNSVKKINNECIKNLKKDIKDINKAMNDMNDEEAKEAKKVVKQCNTDIAFCRNCVTLAGIVKGCVFESIRGHRNKVSAMANATIRVANKKSTNESFIDDLFNDDYSVEESAVNRVEFI